MEFKQFKIVFNRHVAALLERNERLFVTDVDRDALWDLYLDSFPPGTNEIYRERRSHDCSCCRAFIKQFGAVVALDGNEVVTLWDFDAESDTYQPVVDALVGYVRSRPICDLFITKDGAYGTDRSHEQLDGGGVHTWHHFRVDLPARFVTRSHETADSLKAEARTTKRIFKRSLEEISADAVGTVLDLIAEDGLYRGEEWRGPLQAFQRLQDEYRALPEVQRDNYCWRKMAEAGGGVARIRNHSVGVLLQDITADIDVLEAVGRFERIMAPQNYKRPKPVFTKRMVEQAQETVERLGLADSLPRRHARLDDITVNNVLWANRDAVREMEGLGVFEELAREAATDPRRFERAPGIAVEQFMSNVLPTMTSLEVLLENRHEGNLVSLVAPRDRGAPSLFKWDNGFGWAYNGNVADSMKARVKALGGDVTGVLRFSIQWNEGHDNRNDFDAHCVEPGGNHIYFPNKGYRHPSTGMLDVDIIYPEPRQVAVENITWTRLDRMPEGIYHFFVHNYSHRGGRSGFRAEIEHGGRTWEYDYPNDFYDNVMVAKVRFSRRDGIEFVESLPTTTSSREVWGLATNQFHPVSVITYSPNHWDGRGVGNRHWFFMLAGCANPERPNGFFNEYLKEEFMEHKRVFAALGGKMRVERSDSQLSGVGFNSTVRNNLVVRIDGQRVVKIIF